MASSQSDSLQETIMKGVGNMLQKRGLNPGIVTKLLDNAIMYDDILVYTPIFNGVFVKIKSEHVHQMYFLMEQEECKHIILIYNDIAPLALELLISHTVYTIEMFKYKMMMFDPTAHVKTPPHSRLTNEGILKELGSIKVTDLSHILSTDAIVRFYGWGEGDVIKIERNDGVYYRVVVKV